MLKISELKELEKVFHEVANEHSIASQHSESNQAAGISDRIRYYRVGLMSSIQPEDKKGEWEVQ